MPDSLTSDSIKIACRNIWKIFGPHPRQFLERHGPSPSSADFKETGHIGAVRDVSFDVHAGEILVIMGLSGSGKSTLVRCLTRLIEPTAGSIMFDGQDLLGASESQLIELRRHKMGMVFQHFGLLPHRSVLSNVAFPLEVQGLGRAEREARAAEMIKLVGLEGREIYFPRELSGGQQQRVGIARSLAIKPDVWFLDEPFSALDPLIRREMQDEFLRLQKLLKKTIVFITHDFDEATRLADRIGIMKDGALIQLCSPERMVSDPADKYVAEFTKDAPRERILSVASIMEPWTGGGDLESGTILGTAKVGESAARILEAEKPLPVVDATGRPIGIVTRQGLIDCLFRRDKA
jgi:glycine betaine/proline transport system ATP-binding protein